MSYHATLQILDAFDGHTTETATAAMGGCAEEDVLQTDMGPIETQLHLSYQQLGGLSGSVMNPDQNLPTEIQMYDEEWAMEKMEARGRVRDEAKSHQPCISPVCGYLQAFDTIAIDSENVVSRMEDLIKLRVRQRPWAHVDYTI